MSKVRLNLSIVKDTICFTLPDGMVTSAATKCEKPYAKPGSVRIARLAPCPGDYYHVRYWHDTEVHGRVEECYAVFHRESALVHFLVTEHGYERPEYIGEGEDIPKEWLSPLVDPRIAKLKAEEAAKLKTEKVVEVKPIATEIPREPTQSERYVAAWSGLDLQKNTLCEGAYERHLAAKKVVKAYEEYQKNKTN